MTEYDPDEESSYTPHPRVSVATRHRCAERHLKRSRYESLIRPDAAYLCEPVSQLVQYGDISYIIHTKKMVCSFTEDDNVWGLRHTRAVRDWQRLKEQWDTRMAEPKAKRQAEADEEAGQFKQAFKNKSLLEGWHGAQSWSGFGIKPV